MNSRTELPQRIPQKLDLPPIAPPPADLLIELTAALRAWEPSKTAGPIGSR